jgi:hypothetical protein
MEIDMKKLVGIMLLITALVGCGGNNLPAEHAAIGFKVCQVFGVNPKEISSKDYVDGGLVTAVCEAGITVIIEVPIIPVKKGKDV